MSGIRNDMRKKAHAPDLNRKSKAQHLRCALTVYIGYFPCMISLASSEICEQSDIAVSLEWLLTVVQVKPSSGIMIIMEQ